ncbi:flagellar hook-length control protein FliK [Aquimonas voraii]|uniref:Flagellar hook-length control protein FliK n=1 Tax=Aquimonas voraii TaxID=265719 RepID=A0A1G6YJ10_9GAMM|nr:flagellar hook-length control protein FliK [Aquimonas voraii]SDD89983.1 flagellar hook-length control protein FliK [Aquimonas voraii]
MNPSAVSASASGLGGARQPAPRSEGGSSGSSGSGSFTELLAGAEVSAEPTRPLRAAETVADPQTGGADESPPADADASLLAALGLGLVPLPLAPISGGGWSTLSDAGESGLAAAQGLPAASALPQFATATATATRVVGSPTADTTPSPSAGSLSTAALAAGLLAPAKAASVAATTEAQQTLPAAAQSAAATAQAGSAPLPANFAQNLAATAVAPPMQAPRGADTSALEQARLAALTTDATSIRLTNVALRASPRPAADFSLSPLPSQPPLGAATTLGLAPSPAAMPDAMALSLGRADAEPASGLRRVAGETGFLLPTVSFSLERSELGAAPRESLASLPPLLTGARLDPTTPQFSVALGQQMQWMANQQVGRAELRLDPEELGPLEIRLEMSGDEIRAEFSSRSAEVRSLLETQVPRLRELLAEQGFSLADAQVGQERAAYQDGPQQRENFAAHGDRGDAPQVDAIEASPDAPVRTRQGLVDDFA